jgi:hypothetical protein
LTRRNINSLGLIAPPLDAIKFYRGVWVLCTTTKNGDLLKAVNFAACLVSGRYPLWAVYRVGGKFQRFYGSRTELESDYSRLVWRRLMAELSYSTLTDNSLAQRREAIAKAYKTPLLEKIA